MRNASGSSPSTRSATIAEIGQRMQDAVCRHDLKTIVALLEECTDPEMRKVIGKNALDLAAYRGKSQIVIALLEHGVSFYMVWEGERAISTTPLIIALERGRKDHQKLARALMEYGVDLDYIGIQGSAIRLAAGRKGTEMLKLLLEHGAKVNEPTLTIAGKPYSVALNTSVGLGDLEKVTLLIEYGATPESGLHTAAAYGNIEVVRLLLDYGADIEVRSGGYTPLLKAASCGATEGVRFLIAHGADVHARTEKPSYTPNRTTLMEAAWRGSPDTVRLLLEKGVDIDAKDKSGNTALMEAAEAGHNEVIKILLEHGANVHLRNRRFQTALKLAQKNHHAEIIALLKRAGA